MPGRRSPPVEESLLETVEQRVHQRAAAARVLALARAGMHHHAGGLVDHGQVRVFIDHIERNLFRHGLERRGMRLAGDVDVLAAAQLERGFLAARHRPAHRPGR